MFKKYHIQNIFQITPLQIFLKIPIPRPTLFTPYNYAAYTQVSEKHKYIEWSKLDYMPIYKSQVRHTVRNWLHCSTRRQATARIGVSVTKRECVLPRCATF